MSHSSCVGVNYVCPICFRPTRPSSSFVPNRILHSVQILSEMKSVGLPSPGQSKVHGIGKHVSHQVWALL